MQYFVKSIVVFALSILIAGVALGSTVIEEKYNKYSVVIEFKDSGKAVVAAEISVKNGAYASSSFAKTVFYVSDCTNDAKGGKVINRSVESGDFFKIVSKENSDMINFEWDVSQVKNSESMSSNNCMVQLPSIEKFSGLTTLNLEAGKTLEVARSENLTIALTREF